MLLSLVDRAGSDTLRKLECSATLRFREGSKLHGLGELLGATYLFGYAIEITLKVAYYYTIGLVPSSEISYSHRKTAEAQIMPLLTPPGSITTPLGHHLVGWAYLLEDRRAANGNPLKAATSDAMRRHAGAAFLCWREFLRYRANKPKRDEIETIRAAAAWFRRHATRLWR